MKTSKKKSPKTVSREMVPNVGRNLTNVSKTNSEHSIINGTKKGAVQLLSVERSALGFYPQTQKLEKMSTV